MQEQWLHLSDIPVQGREFYFDDCQELMALCREARLEAEPAENMTAMLSVFPQRQGVFFQGYIKGLLVSPCSRCLEPGQVEINYKFEAFEDFDEVSQGHSSSVMLKFVNGHWMIDVLQAMREQMVLAMPDKVVCSSGCLGLCRKCGEDLNKCPCQCENEVGDPRLAVLRQIKIQSD